MPDPPVYDVVVVGGGPAGTTTALYTTRLGHRTALFEKAGGRHASVAHVHNLLGVSEDVSGSELARHAVEQFQEYGGTYVLKAVDDVGRVDGENDGGDADDGDDREGRFVVDAEGATVETERVVFATGFTDAPPSVPDLRRFTGRGLHYCLHCDAYSLGDGPVFVLGHDDHAAHVALVVLNVTDDVDLLLDGHAPTWSEETARQLRAHPVERIDTPVTGAYAASEGGAGGGGTGDAGGGRAGDVGEASTDDVGESRESDADDGSQDEPWLGGLRFEDGIDRAYLGGFAMYGREYNVDLAESLGCALADDGAIAVDEDHETSVAGAYAVGDVTHGQNQTAIALGDGARAGVAIHEDLRRFPVPADAIERGETVEPGDVPAAPADLRARMALVRDRKRHAGLRGPPPDR